MYEWVTVGDIGPDTDWSRALAGIDIVIHLAALAHQIGPLANAREEEFFRVNALGTTRLAQAAVDAGVRRFVMVSSVAAIGPYMGEPLTERTPCAPNTPYGRSKLAAERAIEHVFEGSATDWCILRPPLVYGAGNPGNMQRLLQLIERGFPLPLGRIDSRRSHLFVGNLVELLAVCAVHPNASRRVFLIDDGEPVDTRDLIRQLARLSRRRVYLVPIPKAMLKALGRSGDLLEKILRRPVPVSSYAVDRLMGSLILDSRAVRAALSWTPPYDQAEGLRRTVVAL
jgi:nucleoside-diphosphate-sugar epimerase